MARVAFRNFTGGEVTPTLSARYDLQKFGTFLQTCVNFIPNLHGDIERRPGMKRVCDLGAASVLLPFQFNTEPENNYLLIFQEGQIVIGQEDGLIGVTLESPYALEDVYEISFQQVGDIVYLAHKNYALRKLYRSGDYPDYDWALEEVVLNQSIDAPENAPTVVWNRGTGNTDDEVDTNETYELNYVITAVDEDGVESLPSPEGTVTGRYPTDWVTGDHVTLTWDAVDGAAEYNIYRDSAGYYGLIGISDTTSFDDQNYEADTSTTPKEDWDPFADGNNPSTVTIHQQRLVLGGTLNDPATFYMSRTGDFENFRKSMPLQDDDPVEYMLASGSIDEIKWLASFGELLIGTSGAEYQVTSSGAAITPSDAVVTVESYWGSSGLQPLIIGNSVMHCQRAGSHVRDLAYNWEMDGYAGNDLSLLAPQLVEDSAIKQWTFQQNPGSNIWCVREDGTLLCLTYLREQKVYAWSRHVTEGKVLSACSLCGEDEDVLMLVVQRELNGTTYYTLERLASRFKDGDALEDAFYVDGGFTLTADEATTEWTGLDWLEGADKLSVLADGAPEDNHSIEDGTLTLYYAASKVQVGLPYTSVLAPLPVETDGQNGSTLGKKRAYGKCTLRLYRTVGGSYAASEEGDLFDADAWEERDFYDLPFVAENWGEAVPPFSGDLEITLPAGQDVDASIYLKQDRPLPFRLVAIMADVDFGEM